MIKRIIFFQSLILSSVLLLCAYYFLFGVKTEPLLVPLCALTSMVFIWTIASWNRVTGQFFDLYTIFMLGTGAFNCGQIFLEIAGLNPKGLLFGKFSEATLFETVLFILLGLASIHFGALLRFRTSEKPGSIPRTGCPPPELLTVGVLLTAIAFIPTLLVLREMIEIVRVSGYFGLYGREDQIGMDNLQTLISNLFLPGLLFILAASREKKFFRVAAQLTLLVYGTIFIILGRRGDGAEALLSWVIVRHYCITPIKRSVMLAMASIMLIVIFPLIASVRNIDLGERGNLSMLVQAYQGIDNPATAAIAEMGGSMQAISHTLELVPKTRDYDWGASYYYAALSVFPNLFWKIHPSVARGSPSVWLVNTVEPDIAELGGGLGYSYLAEAYFNFGWWGGALMLMAIGYALSSLVSWSQFSGDPVKIATAVAFFSSLLGFVRADSQSVIRPLFWYSLMPYLLVKILQSGNKITSRTHFEAR
ncbi:MAG: O-antigen polysaccharide polymerase Wzy [Methylotenera sp.]|nr:O-antigen polysaccharide polymerase Wzy [Oligoflexia bacterium]